MDHRVKARLVGASILIALIVVIVPELLSGPAPAPLPGAPAAAPQPVRNITVDLTTAKAPAQQLDADAASSVGQDLHGVASSDVAASGVGAASSVDAAPKVGAASSVDAASKVGAASNGAARSAARLETASPAPTSGARSVSVARAWAVQLGSFASRTNADKLMRQVQAEGFPVYEAPGGSGRALRYRVRVGPMADRGAASQAAAKLKSLGHTASFVPPGS